jgi:3-methylcrotonyl-CoA carboxylase alpha subunit
MRATIQLRHGTDLWTAIVSEGRVSIGDRAYSVEADGPGVYRVTLGDRRWMVTVAGTADERWVFVDGQAGRIDALLTGGAERTGRRTSQDALMAPMPATILEVLTEPGARVTEGETLLVLEAMKMELSIRAPRSGVVTRVRCRAGDLVQPGVELLELD